MKTCMYSALKPVSGLIFSDVGANVKMLLNVRTIS